MNPLKIATEGGLPEYIRINQIDLISTARWLTHIYRLQPRYAGGVYMNEAIEACNTNDTARLFAAVLLLSFGKVWRKQIEALPPVQTQTRPALTALFLFQLRRMEAGENVTF